MNDDINSIFERAISLIEKMNSSKIFYSDIISHSTIEENINILNSLHSVKSLKFSKKINTCFIKYSKEIERVSKLFSFDNGFIFDHYLAGVDEVGRGPLAGPIVAAAVILPKDSLSFLTLINDSKKVSKINREKLSSIIKDYALSYSISEIDNNTIDEKGIAWCNNQVFILSVNTLKIAPDLVLSDGYPIKNCKYRNEFTIKADEKSATVACASIIAKAYRDDLMQKYSKIYPCYGFDHNAGYGTKEHIKSILQNGPCPIHRKSFIKNIIK